MASGPAIIILLLLYEVTGSQACEQRCPSECAQRHISSHCLQCMCLHKANKTSPFGDIGHSHGECGCTLGADGQQVCQCQPEPHHLVPKTVEEHNSSGPAHDTSAHIVHKKAEDANLVHHDHEDKKHGKLENQTDDDKHKTKKHRLLKKMNANKIETETIHPKMDETVAKGNGSEAGNSTNHHLETPETSHDAGNKKHETTLSEKSLKAIEDPKKSVDTTEKHEAAHDSKLDEKSVKEDPNKKEGMSLSPRSLHQAHRKRKHKLDKKRDHARKRVKKKRGNRHQRNKSKRGRQNYSVDEDRPDGKSVQEDENTELRLRLLALSMDLQPVLRKLSRINHRLRRKFTSREEEDSEEGYLRTISGKEWRRKQNLSNG